MLDRLAILCSSNKRLRLLRRVHIIPLSIIDQLKWELGFPKDYVPSIVPDFPDYFKVVGHQNFASGSGGDMRMLELVCWNNGIGDFSSREDGCERKT